MHTSYLVHIVMLSYLRVCLTCSVSLSAKLRPVLSTRTPSRGCQGWCDQESPHQSSQKSKPTTRRSPGDLSTRVFDSLYISFLRSFVLFFDIMFDCVPRSRVYMADLESTLHYSLRVELAAHTVIRGEALVSLKKYTSVLSKVNLPERAMHTVHTSNDIH